MGQVQGEKIRNSVWVVSLDILDLGVYKMSQEG